MVDLEATLRSTLDGRYDIEHEIGRGGMSVVFRAHDVKHNRTVAVKAIRPELSRQIGPERFQREIEVVAGLTHPHILPLHDSGEASGLLYYVMPHIEGGSLRDRMESEGALPEADAIRIVREIADALGYAHEHDVVHRDVKPGNILLAGNHALLADFGIAHLASGDHETLTLAGLALGTPAYLSPEQASGETEVDGRSDIYSLGCVLYEALSGSPPFSGDSIRAMLVHQMVDTPPPVRSLNEGVSPDAESIVEIAFRKEADQRFQTAAEMAEALDFAGSRFKRIPVPLLGRLAVPRKSADRFRLVIAAATAVIAAAALFGIRAIITGGDQPSERPVVRYVVVDYAADDASEIERQLGRRAARYLIDGLDGWTSVSVVPDAAMDGPMTQLRTAGMSRSSLALGAGLAQRLGVDRLIRVQAQDLGGLMRPAGGQLQGNVRVSTTILDPSGQEEYQHIPTRGPADSLDVLMAEVAMQLLELDGEPADYRSLIERSPDHRAIQDYQDGREALRQWRLAEAHRAFESAIARDSSFALAHYLLAQTMYWEMSHDSERTQELGPLIDHHSLRADREGQGLRLRPGERSAVEALRAFWTGDYDLARDRYDEILESEPKDIEALVLRGAVEMEDPILAAHDDGTYGPRRNMNVSYAAFDSAIVLNPDWELSWGHLYEISKNVAEAAYRKVSFGFELSVGDLVSPYEDRETTEQLWFCPIIRADTISWVEIQPAGCPADSTAVASAKDRHARVVELLEYTAAVEGKARHHEELADLLLWERSLPWCEAEPATSDSLSRRALGHFETALEIRADTTPQDRFQLAALRLGAGDLEAALAAAERAIRELPEWESANGTPPPAVAANPFLAAGRPDPAVPILERAWGTNSLSLPDPQDPSRSISAEDQLHTLIALQALGALGVTGSEVESRLVRLRRAWDDSEHSERDKAALRLESLRYVGPALAHSPGEWDAWFGGWERHGLDVPPVWLGMFAAARSPADSVQARENLVRAVDELGADPLGGPVRPIDLYVPLVLASRIGAADVEEELLRRLSRCALSLDQYDAGWAMRSSLGKAD